MINVFYSSIADITTDEQEAALLAQLPAALHHDVLRYHFRKDRVARIVARLMLLHTLQADGAGALFTTYSRTERGKPFIPGWKKFNISHSGSLVVLCTAASDVGIDIEKHEDVDYTEFLNILHADELYAIQRSAAPVAAFYDLWARKEALLKAVGVGLTEGMDCYNCLPDVLVYDTTPWYFTRLALAQGYSSVVCASSTDDVAIMPFAPRLS